MKKTLKCLAVAGLTGAMFFGGSMAAFAGTWRTGAEPNQNRWWYDFDDGSYATNGWQWIDGDNNGVAECYYFDAEGWMLSDTTTPDGYQVSASGAWIENGIVQTQGVQIQETQAQEVQIQETQTQQAPASAGINEYYSGVYRKISEWPLEWLGLDSSWSSVTLTVEGTSGNVAVLINGLAATDATATADGLSFNIPGTECAAFIDGDGILTIYHLATADWANYEKAN